MVSGMKTTVCMCDKCFATVPSRAHQSVFYVMECGSGSTTNGGTNAMRVTGAIVAKTGDLCAECAADFRETVAAVLLP